MTISITSNADGSATIGGPLAVSAATSGAQAIQAQQTIGRNVIVNGDYSISQVNGTTLITPASASWPIDNSWLYTTQTSKLQSQQVSNKLNSLGATTALTYSVLASATIATGDSCVMQLPIEGYNFARFQFGTANAKTASLQFKVNASVGGTYSGAVSNYASSRSYPFTFTLVANTDTIVTMQIPGDTSGTWVGATNAGAAYIKFNLGSGATNLSATSGSWIGANVNGVQGTTGLIAQANGSTLTITDVQFEVGAYCTSFERKLYDQNLRECQRYLPYFSGTTNDFICGAYAPLTTVVTALLPFPVNLRVPPTGIIVAGSFSYQSASNFGLTTPTLSGDSLNNKTGILNLTSVATVAGSGGCLYWSSIGSIYFTGAQI
jgi:hypothetical protein